MPFVEVNLIAEGHSYTVSIDENSDPTKLARGFAKKLGLSGNDYRIVLIGALRISRGVTLKLEKVDDEELFQNLKPIGDI